MALRHDLVMQMPGLKKRYLKYNSYKNQTVHDIFSPKKIRTSHVNLVHDLKTSAFLNKGNDFEKINLPIESQFSNIFSVDIDDYNNDGFSDIILAGNLYAMSSLRSVGMTLIMDKFY